MQVRNLSPKEHFDYTPQHSLAWGLEKDGKLIGRCLAVKSDSHVPEITIFTVDEVWRGKGYGTYFFKQVLRSAGAGCAIWVPRAQIQGFFARFGFVPDGQARYNPSGQDVFRLVRKQEPQINALSIAHDFLRGRVRPGAFVIDATAGRGRDTAFLCRLTGPAGRVLAVDIQPDAVEATNTLLRQKGYDGFAKAILDSHEHLDQYAEVGTVDAIMFNLGYLPGGDHNLFTRSSVSLPAIRRALDLLRPGGTMTVCIYHGGPQGDEEKDALLPFLRSLDAQQYTVMITEFANRSGQWPIPVCIAKHRA